MLGGGVGGGGGGNLSCSTRPHPFFWICFCLVRQFAWPVRVFMVVLSYNEERYGLDRCSMLAFHPRNGAANKEGIKPNRKALEQAHMADHVMAQVSLVYLEFRLVASKAVRKLHLFRTC